VGGVGVGGGGQLEPGRWWVGWGCGGQSDVEEEGVVAGMRGREGERGKRQERA